MSPLVLIMAPLTIRLAECSMRFCIASLGHIMMSFLGAMIHGQIIKLLLCLEFDELDFQLSILAKELCMCLLQRRKARIRDCKSFVDHALKNGASLLTLRMVRVRFELLLQPMDFSFVITV